MDYERYLNTERSFLYQELANDILKDLQSAPTLLTYLSESQKYREDFEFRTTVETARALYFKMTGEHSKVLALSEKLTEQASALELWSLVSANLTIIANTYFEMGLYERSLEIYRRALRNEQTHGMEKMIPLIYNNLAVMFVNMGDFEKGHEYQLLAIEALDRGSKEHSRYLPNLVIYLANLIIYRCHIGRLKEVPEVLERLDALDLSEVSPDALSSYYLGHMYYEFYMGDLEKGREFYLKSVENIPKDSLYRRAVLLHGYLNLFEKLNYDLSFCESEIHEVETLQNDGNALVRVEILSLLRRYYASIEDQNRYDGTTEKYIRYLEEDASTFQKRQLSSMRIVEDLLKDKENVEEVSSRNTELKLIAEEAVRHKNALQSAYQKIEMINELGKKLTSSLDFSSVVDLIRKNLRENVPVGSFIIVIAEPEFQRLRTVVHYNGNQERDNFSADMEDENSLFAECYRKNEILIFHDLEEERRKEGHSVLTVGEGRDVRSAIFMPMEVDGKVIGVCSLQSGGKDLYREEHIDFLEGLLPYLSIALNNAMYSLRLQKEMETRLETQKNLEEANRQLGEANRKLECLSLLDGLTKISNRRDFEHRVIELFERSSKEESSIGIIMLDIDNFKKYNDTYGHLRGDETLKHVARVFRKNLDRVNGISARFGGEEFIGACIGLDEEKIRALGEAICKDVYDLNIEHQESQLKRVTVSVGMAFAERATISQKSGLMRWADISLYRAKTDGKNRAVIKFVEIDDEIPHMLDLE